MNAAHKTYVNGLISLYVVDTQKKMALNILPLNTQMSSLAEGATMCTLCCTHLIGEGIA